jgi:hypothetical protein
MTQTSTSTVSRENCTQSECNFESLAEEEESFYTSIKDELDKISKQPQTETIEAILTFSRSFKA